MTAETTNLIYGRKFSIYKVIDFCWRNVITLLSLHGSFFVSPLKSFRDSGNIFVTLSVFSSKKLSHYIF